MDTGVGGNGAPSNSTPATQDQVDALSNVVYPSSNVAYATSNFAYTSVLQQSNSIYTASNYTYTNLSLQSNIIFPMSNYTYNNFPALSNYTYTNINLQSNIVYRTSNTLYPLSNFVYPRVFNLSGNSLYVQSNVSIGFASSSNSLSVLGQIYSAFDSNWSTGGIRFKSSNGSNDAGIAQGSNGYLRFLSPSNDGAGGFQWINSARNATLMQLDQSGNLNVFANVIEYNTNISDKRFKENIETFTSYEEYLTNLNPVSFTWASNIPNKEKVGQPDIGLIAQDVADVFPSAHSVTDFAGETIHIIKYEKLVPILLAACKDFQERIKHLEVTLSNSNQII
jgi:hypothetical protein